MLMGPSTAHAPMTKAGMAVLKTAQQIVVQMAVLCRLPIEVYLCFCIFTLQVCLPCEVRLVCHGVLWHYE